MLYGLEEKLISTDRYYRADDINGGIYNDSNTMFIFGDNICRSGTGGQACIRRASNSFGIVTKRFPNMDANAFLSDDDYDVTSKIIVRDIRAISDLLRNGKYEYIHIPKDGIGTGLARTKYTAPKTYILLCKLLFVYFGFVNPGFNPY